MTVVKMQIDGVPYDNFKSIAVNRSLEDFSGSFDFSASDADVGSFPIKRGSLIKVTVENTAIVTGYVDSINPEVSADNHDVTIHGRDITADIIDSTLAADDVELTPPVTMEAIVNKVQAALGLSIPIINKTSIQPFGVDDLISCEAGQSGFEFIEQHARKKQILVTTNGDGSIVITRADPTDTGIVLLNQKNGTNNNIKESRVTYDDSERFGAYVVLSQSNLVGLNNYDSPDLQEAVYVKSGKVVDSDIRQSRIMHIISENPSDTATTIDRAKWELSVRKARSMNYSCTIKGIINPVTNKPYELNGLATVIDDDCKLNGLFLVKSIIHNISLYDGNTTTLGLTYRDAYTIEISEPVAQKRATSVGGSFF